MNMIYDGSMMITLRPASLSFAVQVGSTGWEYGIELRGVLWIVRGGLVGGRLSMLDVTNLIIVQPSFNGFSTNAIYRYAVPLTGMVGNGEGPAWCEGHGDDVVGVQVVLLLTVTLSGRIFVPPVIPSPIILACVEECRYTREAIIGCFGGGGTDSSCERIGLTQILP